MRFYLDENVAFAVARMLRVAGIDTLTVSYAGMRGKTDPEQLAYATRLGRVLVTRDVDFEELARQSSEHAGVVYAWAYRVTNQALVDELINLHKTGTNEAMRGHLKSLGI